MIKEDNTIKGTVTGITTLDHIARVNKPDMFKKILKVEMDDGQVLFPEVRNQRLKLMDKENIEEGCRAEITFRFHGSQKGKNYFNNLYVVGIKRL